MSLARPQALYPPYTTHLTPVCLSVCLSLSSLPTSQYPPYTSTHLTVPSLHLYPPYTKRFSRFAPSAHLAPPLAPTSRLPWPPPRLSLGPHLAPPLTPTSPMNSPLPSPPTSPLSSPLRLAVQSWRLACWPRPTRACPGGCLYSSQTRTRCGPTANESAAACESLRIHVNPRECLCIPENPCDSL